MWGNMPGMAGHVLGSACKVHLPSSDAYTVDRLTSHLGLPSLWTPQKTAAACQSRLPNLTLHWLFISRTWPTQTQTLPHKDTQR